MPRGLKIITAAVLIVIGLASMGLIWVRDSSRRPEYCARCHVVMDPYYSSWESSDYLAHEHATSAIPCQTCHPRTIGELLGEIVTYARGEYEAPLQEQKHPLEECFQCHGSYEEVIQSTEGLELNPHDSHISEISEMECSICHKMHRASEDYCAQCHGPVATGLGWTTEVSPTTEVLAWWDPDMDCTTCHVMDSYSESLQDANLLAYVHAQEGLVCLDCHELAVLQQVHEEAVPGTPIRARKFEMEFCFDCHLPNEHTSYEEIIERTKDLEEKVGANPHDSHFGEMECYLCHKVHRESEDYCAQCHAFVWTTPVSPTPTTPTPPTTEVLEWDPDMDCTTCHVMDSYSESLQDANLLAYVHAQEGLVCLDCHELAVLQQVHEGADPDTTKLKERKFSNEFCFDCHLPNEHTSYEEIIERTKDYTVDDQKINPHDPHAGLEEMEKYECRYCHKMHKESPLIKGCYGCHHTGTFKSCSACHVE